MHSDIAPRLARNSVYYAAKSFVALAAMLLITPFIISTIGKERYGIWALVGVLTSYVQLSDFGITESLVKYAAEYHANRDTAQLNRLVNSASAFLMLLAVIIGCIMLLLLPFVITNILHIPPYFQEEALLIFRLAVVVFLLNMFMGVFTALVISSQKIGYTCSVSIFSSVFGFIVTIVLLKLGFGLRGMIATNAIVVTVVGAINMAVAFKLFPELQLNFRKWVDFAMIRQICTFGWKIQVSGISQLMIFQIDRILLSRYLGLEAVAYYEIGSTVAYYAKTFLSVLFTPILPAVSALNAKNEQKVITGLYHRSFKFMVLVAVPFSLFVMAAAEPFIVMWMGKGFELSILTLQLLIPAYLVHILTSPGAFILNGINRPDVAMRSHLLAGFLNLALAFTLVKSIGYFGLIIGVSISLVVAAVYFVSMFHKIIPGIEFSMYGRTVFKPFIFSVPVATAIYYAGQYVDLANISSLLMVSLLYGAIVMAMLLKSSCLDDFERKILRSLLGSGSGKTR